jgi:hypothetical protein
MPQKILIVSEAQDKALKALKKKMGCQFESEIFRSLLNEKIKELGI